MRRRTADNRFERDFSMPPSERKTYGCTVTAIDLVTDERMTLARTGMSALDALRSIVADLDMLDGDWRVMCVSHPGTIERDLYAHRVNIHGEAAGYVDHGNLPEFTLLKRIGRRELVYEAPRVDRRVYHGPKLRGV